MYILAKKHGFSIFARFPIVILIVINGAGRDWWAKKINHFHGILLFSMLNNNNGPSLGLIF